MTYAERHRPRCKARSREASRLGCESQGHAEDIAHRALQHESCLRQCTVQASLRHHRHALTSEKNTLNDTPRWVMIRGSPTTQ